MEQLIAEMLHDGVLKEDVEKRKRNSAKAVGGGSGGRWVQWVVYVAGVMLASSACGIVLHQAIAPSRYSRVCHPRCVLQTLTSDYCSTLISQQESPPTIFVTQKYILIVYHNSSEWCETQSDEQYQTEECDGNGRTSEALYL